jgi:hypothetical protein
MYVAKGRPRIPRTDTSFTATSKGATNPTNHTSTAGSGK